MKLSIIVALVNTTHGIGYQGNIPWRLKKEMAYFAKMTTLVKESGKQNAVIMGRKTWESIPGKFRPLKGRINIVLSRSQSGEYPEDLVVCRSFPEALQALKKPPLVDSIENVWVIGGSSVYQEAMESSACHRLYVTRIKKEFECDTFFPKIPEEFVEVKDENVPSEPQEEDGISYEYKVYEKRPSTPA
ncbi:dihydrofolate reductase-like [Macrosteles quadrilineatus]|uniref:dihydrofolate reductase-like n=1 Tax=Macrosteles quadrilineatus TaxID=74068 RepID=UPI0023E23555|nr:dihydrofolate reductase-like [Macrosteles quadrilineatus]